MEQFKLFTTQFYPTIPTKEEDRLFGQNQQNRIHHWFVRNRRKATSYQVHKATGINLLSTRRAMTNLCSEGVLVKCKDGRTEDAGKFNHYYELL